MTESWPAVVGRLTGQQVYNLGLGGYGPNQYYELLKRHIARLKPKWVVCAIYMGDDFENAFLMTYGRDYWKPLRRGTWAQADADIWRTEESSSWHRRIRVWLSRTSIIYRLVVHGPLIGRLKQAVQLERAAQSEDSAILSLKLEEAGIREAFRPLSLRSRLDQGSPLVREGMRITFELIQRMNALSQQHGARFAVVVIPTKETVFADYLLKQPDGDLREAVDRLVKDEKAATGELLAFLDRRRYSARRSAVGTESPGLQAAVHLQRSGHAPQPERVPGNRGNRRRASSARRPPSADRDVHLQMGPDRISVCICTYRRPELLRRLLDSLTVQKSDPSFTFDVVVIDNDRERSAESTVAASRASGALNITYGCEPEQNISLTRNRAVRNAAGNLIAFIDDDERPSADWLAQLHRTLRTFGADGALGPVVPDYPEGMPAWVRKGGFCERRRLSTGTFITAADARTGNVLLSRSLFPDGDVWFDPAFGRTGGEDSDFFLRKFNDGRKFVWCDEAAAFEAVPPERWTESYYIKRHHRSGTQDGERMRAGKLPGDGQIARNGLILVAGLGLAPFTPFLRADHRVKVLRKLAYCAGVITGNLGLSFRRERDEQHHTDAPKQAVASAEEPAASIVKRALHLTISTTYLCAAWRLSCGGRASWRSRRRPTSRRPHLSFRSRPRRSQVREADAASERTCNTDHDNEPARPQVRPGGRRDVRRRLLERF